MIVAGIGCRPRVGVADVEAAIAAALLTFRVTGNELGMIAIPSVKADEPGIVAAAAARRVPLVSIAQHALEAVSAQTTTRSAHAMAAMKVNCVAEAAALAGAGSHPRLLGPRVAVGPVTCALARGDVQQ